MINQYTLPGTRKSFAELGLLGLVAGITGLTAVCSVGHAYLEQTERHRPEQRQEISYTAKTPSHSEMLEELIARFP